MGLTMKRNDAGLKAALWNFAFNLPPGNMSYIKINRNQDPLILPMHLSQYQNFLISESILDIRDEYEIQ